MITDKNMSKDNIFDLTKMIPSSQVPKTFVSSKTYSTDEKKNLLNGYMEVPQTKWSMLEKGDHIRYERLDGKFRRGGYVSANYIDSNTGERKIRLIWNHSLPAHPSSNATWVLKTNDIKTIWKKTKGPGASMELKLIMDRVTSLETKHEDLQNSISKLNKDIYNIVAWIKQNNKKK